LLFTITGRHIEITEAIREHAEEKASKLPRYFNGVNQVDVKVDGRSRGIVSAEVIARGEHRNVFVVTGQGDDVFRAIDSAIHKLEGRLKKKKAMQRNRKHPLR
jgi:putative sigma-54 modulation protein